jgi:hypothetical protein
MILGLASDLPHTLASGLQAHGISASAASSASHTPPVSVLFAAFLGYNPIEHLVGTHALASLSAANHATLVGRSFFPQLIAVPFRNGLHEAFAFAILACLVAAGASLLRGGKYHYVEEVPEPPDGVRATRALANGAAVNGESLDPGAGELARTTTAEEQHAR